MKLGFSPELREIKEKRENPINKDIAGTHLKEIVCRLEGSRSKEESNVLFQILESECSGSTMNSNGFFPLVAFLHLYTLPNAMGEMERLCFCALSPAVVELWYNNQHPHLKACHQIELRTLYHCIQIANGQVPVIIPGVCTDWEKDAYKQLVWCKVQC